MEESHAIAHYFATTVIIQYHKCTYFYSDYVRRVGSEGLESMQKGKTAKRTFIYFC